ncbi:MULTISPECIES: hypothetical protein [unclassified Aeromicrobium]|uniref:hypothetical protein n=1 Tax=unclassified Aeromicrobium TaxID=2633570 RepID=UPI002889C688|nr:MULTISPECIES: hypothetical protein [unclassified Aeromicrobium]
MRVLSAVLALLLLAGCSDPEPTPPTQEQRADAEAKVEELAPDAWGLGAPIAEARQDICQEGQQSSKVSEVDSACTLGRSWIVPAAASRSDVAGAIDDLSDRLADAGCESAMRGGLDVAARYWREGVQSEPGSLPGSSFRCGSRGVDVSTVSPEQPGPRSIVSVGDLTGGTVGEKDTDDFGADVRREVEASGQALLWQITVTQTYAVRR